MAVDGRETWRPVVGFEGYYEVSDMGRVLNKRTGRMITISTQSTGYRTVGLIRNGIIKTVPVHRLVLFAFDGKPEADQQGAHLNGDKSDNRLENLKWASCSENQLHKHVHGRAQIGETSVRSKLREVEVQAIRRRYVKGCTNNGVAALAREFEVSESCVRNVVKGRTWIGPPELPSMTRGGHHTPLARS